MLSDTPYPVHAITMKELYILIVYLLFMHIYINVLFICLFNYSLIILFFFYSIPNKVYYLLGFVTVF